MGIFVCPAGVPDPTINGGIELVGGFLSGHTFALFDLSDELIAATFHHLGDSVEDLTSVVGRGGGPLGESASGRKHSVACVLAAGLGDIGDEFAVRIGDFVGASGFAARERTADEEFVRLANIDSAHDLSSASR